MTLPRVPRPEEPGEEELPRMSLLDHLEELRKRIVWSLLFFGIAFFVCWNFSKQIFHFLASPVYATLQPGTKLSFLGLTDPFILYMKVAALAAAFVSAPFLLWQIWGFIAPGLYKRERRWAAPFVIAGTLFFLGGGAFAYYVAFPFTVAFLLGVGTEFQAVITAEGYFSFLMTVILGLGLMFEMPVVIVILSQVGVVTPRFLMRHFRWAVLIIFTAAAILTPTPDVFNMSVFAVPTLALYLLGVGVAALLRWQKARNVARTADAVPGES